jgi:hypothetical protein
MFRGGGRAPPMLEWLRTMKMDRPAVQIAGSVMLQRYMILKRRHIEAASAINRHRAQRRLMALTMRPTGLGLRRRSIGIVQIPREGQLLSAQAYPAY